MNVRMNLVQLGLVALPLLSVAQPKQLITSARPSTARTVSHTTTVSVPKQNAQAETAQSQTKIDAVAKPAEEAVGDPNTLPLFGERAKTAAQIDAEIHFLNDCDRNFATRTEASEFFANRGWDYVMDGQLDTAAHRFNLAWLLNDRNPDAYWGLGVVSYQKDRLPDAISMLKRGLAVADSNATLMTDLATVQLKYFQENLNPDVLEEADQHLQRAIALNPGGATPYQKLSLLNYLKADYPSAWAYFHKARAIDLSGLDLSYLNELLAKMPDPEGVFK